MVRGREFDVAELGLTFYLRSLDHDAPFIAIPVFPNRVFRHSCMFVNTSSGIDEPKDLAGKTIGEFGTYGQDSGVWAKGILMDDYGFKPELSRWVIGGLDSPMQPFDFIDHPHPANVDVTVAPEHTTLGKMLEDGEIDALFTANVPQCVLDGSPRVTRLFPDFEPLERDYYRRTPDFPDHAYGRRSARAPRRTSRSDSQRLPRLPRRQGHGRRRLPTRTTALPGPHHGPWTTALFEHNRELFAEDWWPYGVSANHTAIDTYLRYHYEQGLSLRRWTVEEIFVPTLLET